MKEERQMQKSRHEAGERYDIQGKALGIPYDFRWPTLARIKERLWQEGGPMFPPKVWGWGWTLNLAHKGSWVLLTALLLAMALLVGFGGLS